MKQIAWVFSVLLVAGVGFAQEFALGGKVGNFTLSDAQGAPVEFSALKGDITVVLFVATKCPISNDYNERMKALYQEYSAKGVKFVVINSNSSEPASEVADHMKQNGFPFLVYKDANNVVADRFGATVTPESFVIDKTGTIRYHGHIDDSRNPTRIQTQGLRLALDAVLAGGEVKTTETKAFGCTIKRAKKS